MFDFLVKHSVEDLTRNGHTMRREYWRANAAQKRISVEGTKSVTQP